MVAAMDPSEAVSYLHQQSMPTLAGIASHLGDQAELPDLLARLPPSSRKRAEQLVNEEPTGIRLLRAIADITKHPSDNIRQVLATPMPAWLERLPPVAWAFLAEAAASYLVNDIAVECFERVAAERLPVPAHWLARAALAHSVVGNPDRALDLLRDAIVVAGEEDFFVQVISAFIHEDWHDVIHLVVGSSDQVMEDLSPNFYRAIALSRIDALDQAIQVLRDLRSQHPEAINILMTLSKFLLYKATRSDGLKRSRDLAEAAELATLSRRLMAPWRGPSGACVDVLAKVEVIKGNREAVFTLCLPAPDGDASLDEAQYPGVLEIVGLMAVDRRRQSILEWCISRLPDGSPSRLLLEGAWRVASGSVEEGKDLLFAALAASSDDVQRSRAIRALATAGVWPISGTADLLADAPTERGYLQALALHQGGHYQQAREILEPLSTADRNSLELLAEVYERLGQTDEAVRVFERGAVIFGDPDLAGQVALVLADAGRLPEAIAKAKEVMATLFPRSAMCENCGGCLCSSCSEQATSPAWLPKRRRMSPRFRVILMRFGCGRLQKPRRITCRPRGWSWTRTNSSRATNWKTVSGSTFTAANCD
jgi:tetratricopeptide (TPR) repeat protein